MTPETDSPGATINYQLSGVLSNGTTGMQVKTSVQLTVEKEGDQFKIAAIWPPVLEQRPFERPRPTLKAIPFSLDAAL